MNLGFKNKNVMVIGGSSGIGLSTVITFAQANATVYSVSRTKEKIDLAKKHLKNKRFPGKIEFIAADTGNLNGINELITGFSKNKIQFDILVNCAGYYEKCELLEVKESFWDDIYHNNIKLTFFVSQLIVKEYLQYKKAKKLDIINLGSFASILPSYGFGLYASAKAALSNLTKTMAAEWAEYNVRVNCVIPGVIETPMTENVIINNKSKILSPIALKRIGTPSEVASVILFLASENASYICGATIDVTGGKFLIQN